MASPETTILISLGGSLAVAALPTLTNLLLGDRIARRKALGDQEAAYRLKIFDTAVAERALLIANLQQRIADLEASKRQAEAAILELEKEIRSRDFAAAPHGPSSG